MVVKFMQRQGREELLNISVEKNLVDQGTQDWWAELEVRFPRGLGLPLPIYYSEFLFRF